jgi:hypothetical protein
MKFQKKENIPIPLTPKSPEILAQYLSELIPRQVELGSQAIQCNEGALAALLACQIFDLLDWSRIHLDQADMTMLHDRILVTLSRSSLHFTDLQQLEAYAETHFVGAD